MSKHLEFIYTKINKTKILQFSSIKIKTQDVLLFPLYTFTYIKGMYLPVGYNNFSPNAYITLLDNITAYIIRITSFIGRFFCHISWRMRFRFPNIPNGDVSPSRIDVIHVFFGGALCEVWSRSLVLGDAKDSHTKGGSFGGYTSAIYEAKVTFHVYFQFSVQKEIFLSGGWKSYDFPCEVNFVTYCLIWKLD